MSSSGNLYADNKTYTTFLSVIWATPSPTTSSLHHLHLKLLKMEFFSVLCISKTRLRYILSKEYTFVDLLVV